MIAMSKGFKQPQQADQRIDRIVRYCHKRSPEALDRVFDTLPHNDEHLSQQIIAATVAQLRTDLDTLSWFCGYMASEINHSEDSDRAHLPLTSLSAKLITLGFQPFIDFVPYPGRRIIILDADRFAALPVSIQAEIKVAFDLMEQSGEQVQQVNEALSQELFVSVGGNDGIRAIKF
jgi:hypothetical protein